MPKPARAATASTPRSLSSSSRSASAIRCSCSQRSGVVPVSARKWRANERTLQSAWAAISTTVSGCASRSSAHARVGARPPPAPVRAVDELRLAPLAVGRDDHPAGDRGRHACAVVGAHKVQAEVDPGRHARAGRDVAVIDEQHAVVDLDRRDSAARARRRRPQWVVARRPSSSPASASANAPVHTDTIRAPRACAARSASATPSASRSSSGLKPGTVIVSRRSSASRPNGATTSKPVVVGTGPGAAAQIVNV